MPQYQDSCLFAGVLGPGVGGIEQCHCLNRWKSNHIHYKVWDEITKILPNFSGATVDVWEWISNFIPHFIMDVITYPGCLVQEWELLNNVTV